MVPQVIPGRFKQFPIASSTRPPWVAEPRGLRYTSLSQRIEERSGRAKTVGGAATLRLRELDNTNGLSTFSMVDYDVIRIRRFLPAAARPGTWARNGHGCGACAIRPRHNTSRKILPRITQALEGFRQPANQKRCERASGRPDPDRAVRAPAAKAFDTSIPAPQARATPGLRVRCQ